METIIGFLMTPLMAGEILLAEFFAARHFERRSYFYLRFFGSAFVCVCLTVWAELLYFILTGIQFNYGNSPDTQSIVFKIFYYLFIFGMTIGCVFFSYKQSFTVVLVCCSLGYAMQYLVSNLGALFSLLEVYMESPGVYIYWLCVRVATLCAVYIPMYFLLADRKFEEETYLGNNRKKVLLCFLVILVCIVLSRLIYDDPERSVFAKIAEPIYAMLCSAFIIVVEFSMARNDIMHKELAHVTELLHLERKQYSMNKESIEIINEKCHDLKHQVAMLRVDGSEKHIAEIEKAIMIYDSTVKTGSDVLDILLTEKKLLCESKNIKFTTVVSGELISFMNDVDIYSLFGNAISNAIESVASLKNESMRHIAMKVRRMGDMCSIHIENYYDGEIEFQDELPKTDKDERYHGFGMKSMQRIVASYGGVMSVTAQRPKFSLDILIPLDKPDSDK